MDLLEDIMDEQFDTVCEDDSVKEVSNVLMKFFTLAKEGKIEQVRTEISQMTPCANWIMPTFQVKKIKEESSSDEDEDDDDNNMDVAASNSSNNNMIPSTSGSTMDFEEEDPDPGWTVVKKGGKYK